MGSIYLYSERSHQCLELKAREIHPSDLVDLQGLLPRNLKGIQFAKPSVEGGESFLFHSETRQSYVTKYLTDVGQKLMGLGQPLGALRFFDLALRVRQDPQVAVLRAETLFGLGRIEEAQKEVERFLRWQPQNGPAHYLLGRIHLYRNDYRGAEFSLRRALHVLSSDDPRRGAVKVYLEFNQIYLDRDSLYSRDLTTQDYVSEIQNLRQRAQALKTQILDHSDRDVRGMEPHLDSLDKVFERWVVEIVARNPEVLHSAQSQA